MKYNNAPIVDAIDFIATCYPAMKAVSKTKTFFGLGRENLKPVWSFEARGIMEEFKEAYTTFLPGHFFNDDSDNFIGKLFEEAPIRAYADALREEVAKLPAHQKQVAHQLIVEEFKDDASAYKNMYVFGAFMNKNGLVLGLKHDQYEANEEPKGPVGYVEPTEPVAEPVKPVSEEPTPVYIEEVKKIEVKEPVKQKLPTLEPKEEKKQSAPVMQEEPSEGDDLNATLNLLLPVGKMIDKAVKKQVESMGLLDDVNARILAAAEKLTPTVIKIGERKPVTLVGSMHDALPKLIKFTTREMQSFISGPAGSGKTTLAANVAAALNVPFGFIACTQGMSEGQLLGRMNAHGDYLPSKFIELYENGGLFLFDEVDAADSNTMLVINSALANGHVSVPNRIANQVAHRHKDFYLIAAANTWGFGSADYVGRNPLDAAFLDRFAGSKLFIDYDTKLETAIAKEHSGLKLMVWNMRQNVRETKMKRVVSTRAIVSGVRALMDGDTLKEFFETLTTGWTVEEVAKVTKGIDFKNK